MEIKVVFRLDDRKLDGTYGLCISKLSRNEQGKLFWEEVDTYYNHNRNIWSDHEWLTEYKVIPRTLRRSYMTRPWDTSYQEGDL